MLQVIVNVFLKSFSITERGMWLSKKNGQVPEISKTMGTQIPAMKKIKRKRKRK
jgi:hypothetical protein